MLLDTSGLLAVLDHREPLNTLACSLLDAAQVRLTHNYVLAELIPLAQVRGVSRNGTLDFMVDLLDNPDIEVVWIDKPLHQEALALLFSRLDKTYSLCDAVSFILMRRRGLIDSLTTDRHFEQEGFRRLLKTTSTTCCPDLFGHVSMPRTIRFHLESDQFGVFSPTVTPAERGHLPAPPHEIKAF